MYTKFHHFLIAFSFIGLAFTSTGCEKDELLTPKVETALISKVNITSDPERVITTLGGNVTMDNGKPVTSRGVCWSFSHNPTINDNMNTNGEGLGAFSSELGFHVGYTYYVRAFATSSEGTAYGKEEAFITGELPKFNSIQISQILSKSANCSCEIAAGSSSEISATGLCWSTEKVPNIDLETKMTSGKDLRFSYTLTDLKGGATHFLCAYITLNNITYYSNVSTFRTMGGASAASVTDIDGNTYQTKTIGTQTWMVENLRTTKYRNGELIGTTVPANKDISYESEPAYQWAYNGDESNVLQNGRFYTWSAATDSRNIAPVGWHIPTIDEIVALMNYLYSEGYNYSESGTDNMLGKSMASETLWQTDMNAGTVGCDLTKNNYSLFNALPSGIRRIYGTYEYLFNKNYFWCSTIESSGYANAFGLSSDSKNLLGYFASFNLGLSIRCIKDTPASASSQNTRKEPASQKTGHSPSMPTSILK